MNKADNLPMSAEEWTEKHYPKFLFSKLLSEAIEDYFNYALPHHINVLAERIAEKAKTVCGYGDCDMPYCDMQCQAVDSNSIREIAKDYINELNLQSSK